MLRAIVEVRTISFCNNKGGSGKTTTVVSLAAAFAERGLRILVIDLDPQGSTTMWLGGRESSAGLVEFSAGVIQVSELVKASTAPGVDLVPTSPSLMSSGDASTYQTGLAIIWALRLMPDYWDLILVDTPPTLGYLSLAPLVAGDYVVIPAEAHALAMPGVASVIASIERARRQVNPQVKILGIVACRVSPTNHVRDVVAQLRARFGAVVLEHSVRDAIRIAEAPALRLPITRYAPTSSVANDYRAVAAELLDRLGDLSST